MQLHGGRARKNALRALPAVPLGGMLSSRFRRWDYIKIEFDYINVNPRRIGSGVGLC